MFAPSLPACGADAVTGDRLSRRYRAGLTFVIARAAKQFTRAARCVIDGLPRFDRKDGLEDVFAHIPFPADPEVFAQAIASGREIRPLQAYFCIKYPAIHLPPAVSSLICSRLSQVRRR